MNEKQIVMDSVCELSNEAKSEVKRWDKKAKAKVEVDCPSTNLLYNQFMEGVDLLDSLFALSQINIRSKKYYHRLFFPFLDVVVVNAWLLYRRNCYSFGVNKNKPRQLCQFKTELAEALYKMNKDLSGRKCGRPSSSADVEYVNKRNLGHESKLIPQRVVRQDNVGHWPVVFEKRGRYKQPNGKGSPSIVCQKCGVHLRIERKRNCFLDFHRE
ncbi:piggyBac transposable element-derived protein 3-like [Schistocerca gregaria]|uniref:piggyBac transposable element-derived protein 3-like n=1 Tax=Schistocerca gregaria TaxID=7010 RepID=UPI00211E0995|nr:piggyBac transposable element-derived protein 3-like [Schistocerca gregaria]